MGHEFLQQAGLDYTGVAVRPPQPPEIGRDDVAIGPLPDRQMYTKTEPLQIGADEHFVGQRIRNTADSLTWKSGTGRDSRSHHLTHEGVNYLQKLISAYTRQNKIAGGSLNAEQLQGFVDILESQYEDVPVGDRDGEQWFAATAARLYRSQLDQLKKGEVAEVSTSAYFLMVDRSKHRPALSNEGKHFIDLTLKRGRCVNAEGGLDYNKINNLSTWFGEKAEKQAGDAEAFFNLAKKSLDKRVEYVERLSFMESMAVSNSPWSQVVDRLRRIPRFANVPEQFVTSMVATYAQKLDTAAQTFSNDDLDKSMLTHVVADQLCQAISSEESAPEGEAYLQSCLDRMAGQSISPEYSAADQIDTILCKSRFLSESPQFVISQLENQLIRLNVEYDQTDESSLRQLLGEQYTEAAARSHIDFLRQQIDQIQLHIEEASEHNAYLNSHVDEITDHIDLANALREYYADHLNAGYEDALFTVKDMSWVPEDYRQELNDEVGKAHEGIKGKLLGLKAGIAKKLKGFFRPQDTTQTRSEQAYQAHIEESAKRHTERRDRHELRTLFGLADLSNEYKDHRWMKKINLVRLGMMGINTAISLDQGLPTNGSEVNLQQIIEGPIERTWNESMTETPITHAVEAVRDFFSEMFAPKEGFKLTGTNTPNAADNQARLQQLMEQTATEPAATATEASTATTEPTIAPTATTEPTTIPTTVPTETPPTQEMTDEAPQGLNITEFLFGKGSGIYEMFLNARLDAFENMDDQAKEKYLEAIGGAENLDNGKITFMLVGEDRTVEDERQNSASDARTYDYGHADQTHLISYDPRTNEVSILSFPRHMIVPEGQYSDLTQVTWDDNLHAEKDGYQNIALMGVDATGVPVDGVLSFSMDGVEKAIDTFFPEGVDYTIGKGERFKPAEEDLLKITGYKSFEEGETYKFSGSEIRQFLRSRYTSVNGSYDREERAGGMLGRMVGIMFSNFKAHPEDFVRFLSTAATEVEGFENAGFMRMHWNVGIDDPDQSGQVSNSLGDVMQLFTTSLVDPGNAARLMGAIAANPIEKPVIEQMALSPDATEQALKVTKVGEFQSLAPDGKESQAYNLDGLRFWENVRDHVQQVIYSENSGEQGEAIENSGPVRVMFLGDSQISSGFIPDKAAKLMTDQGLQIEVVGAQEAGPSESVHEGHPKFSTQDILRDLEDRSWGDNEAPVEIAAAKPDVIVIQLGTNDAGKGLSTEETIENYAKIVTKLREENPNVKIVISKVPPLAVEEANTRVMRINEQLPGLVERLNQSDSFPDSKVVFAQSDDISYTQADLGDGMHLNYSGEDKAAQMQAEAVKTVLASN